MAYWSELTLVVMFAILIDLLVGDPYYPLHPVRLIGAKIALLERCFRWLGGRHPHRRYLRFAGLLTAVATIAISAGLAWLLLDLCRQTGKLAGFLAAVFLTYSSFSIRDLRSESLGVLRRLRADDLDGARRQLARIVGRDTGQLDRKGIVRATLETVAESACDGIIAPLCFAVLLGPVGAVAYRAINTLDSMIAHKNERYLYFGWGAAWLDDIANFLPARLTALLLAAATLLRPRGTYFQTPAQALGIAWRDAAFHPSPNAGWPEATAAGALGVQLGGTSYYDGQPYSYPNFGDATRSLMADDIIRINQLVIGAVLFFCALLTLPFFVTLWLQG